MEILRIAQIVKNSHTKEIGVVIDVTKQKKMNIFEATLHTLSFGNLLYSFDCVKLGFGFWESFLQYWEDTYFIRVLFSKGDIDYCMDEWEPVTKEELHAYLKEKGSLLGFTWVP